MPERVEGASDPVERVRVLGRAHALLHDEHRAERAKYPKHLDAAETRAFKTWEKTVWWPRLQALDQQRHAADAEARKVRGYEQPADPEATDPLLAERNAAKQDATLDAEIDLEAVITRRWTRRSTWRP